MLSNSHWPNVELPYSQQNYNVLTCCALYNFMRDQMSNNEYLTVEAVNGVMEDAHEPEIENHKLHPVDMSQESMDRCNDVRWTITNHVLPHKDDLQSNTSSLTWQDFQMHNRH